MIDTEVAFKFLVEKMSLRDPIVRAQIPPDRGKKKKKSTNVLRAVTMCGQESRDNYSENVKVSLEISF